MDAAVERQLELLIDACYRGMDATALRLEVLRRLRRILSVDAAFFATLDPVTLLFTSAVSEEPLQDVALEFMDNEFGDPDVNRFADLANRPDPIASLDGATRGHRGESRRYSEIMEPLDLGDELRVVLRSRGHSWGALCLHRLDAATGFSPLDIAVLRRLAPHIAEGLRRAHLIVAIGAGEPMDAGIVLLDEQMHLASMNPAAERWLAEIADDHWPTSLELPVPVYAVAMRANAAAVAPAATFPNPGADAAQLRLRTSTGSWVLVHASRMIGPGSSHTAVVIESAAPQRIGSVLLATRGLTPAQERVAAFVLRGATSREIAAELHLSRYTVQEHLSGIFDKFGVRSRRELVTAVLAPPQPADR